jgi:hypothetical protein
MSRMAPPSQYVGLGQDCRTKAMLGLIEGRRPNGNRIAELLFQGSSDNRMDALGIDLGDDRIFALVDVFVPNSDPNGTRHT